MDTFSFWAEPDTKRRFPSLDCDINTEACIIGGGLAGLMCAEALLKNGVKDIVIIDAGKIGGGDTQKSSAMISFAHDLIYDRLIVKNGIEAAKEYFTRNRQGIGAVREIIRRYSIECDYQDCEMLLYATTKKGAKALFKEQEAYQNLGFFPIITTETELPFPVIAALKIKDQGRLNPYRFTFGLANALSEQGVRFYENTEVTEQPENGILKIGTHTINATHYIMSTHYPFLNFPGFYFLKMYQSRSYNIVFDAEMPMKDIYESAESDGFEYRSVGGNLVLCGGGGIRTGKNKRGDRFLTVKRNITKAYGNRRIISQFSAQDCMTSDMMPFAGLYSKLLDNVYVVTGFNKWGFTTAAACAEIVADMISGRNDGQDNPFDPARLYALKSPIKTARNIGTILFGWLTSLFSPDAKRIKKIRPGTGEIVRIKGKRCGVYKHENGNMDIVTAVCPHLGCSLKWNQDDLSWDCPCHGSRFDIKGNILNNPSIKDAAIE